MERITNLKLAAHSMREAVSDFIELFALEGRIASLSLVRLIVLAIAAGLFCVIAWLFVCLAAMAALVSAYDWEWAYALLLLAGIHVVVAVAVAAYARKSAANAFFPSILGQLRSKSRHGHRPKPHYDLDELEKEREICDAALTHARVEAVERIENTTRELRTRLTSPGVIAGAVAVGVALAFLRRSPHRGRHQLGAHAGSSLTSMLAKQMSGLVAAKVIAAIMDRQRRNPGATAQP